VVEFENTNNCAIWADIDVEGTTLRVISVHMQTTSFDRMRSKAAQARAAANEEGERQIYLNFTDNLESNMIERANQALMVEEIMKSTDHPTILCGDFNDTPGTYTYETLKGDMKDGFQTGGKGFAWTYRGLYNLLRIDYIFHSKELKGLEYESMDYEMSDHNPVMMTLCIEE
jgi:endonuclease/exonuclease/phosphatase family metal-dependent hydrolase